MIGLFDEIAGRLRVHTASNCWDPRYVHVGITTVDGDGLLMRGVRSHFGPGGSTQPAEIARLYAEAERVVERFNRRRRRLSA